MNLFMGPAKELTIPLDPAKHDACMTGHGSIDGHCTWPSMHVPFGWWYQTAPESKLIRVCTREEFDEQRMLARVGAPTS